MAQEGLTALTARLHLNEDPVYTNISMKYLSGLCDPVLVLDS